MVSLGQSASRMIQDQFEGLGPNMILVFPASNSRRGVHEGAGTTPTLTPEDCEAIRLDCPSVLEATPLVFAAGQAVYGNMNWSPKGNQRSRPRISGRSKLEGTTRRVFHGSRCLGAGQVCVIGQTVARQLFQTMDPLDETIRVANIPFRVVGVLEARKVPT